jgi:hypothetical protein
MSVKDKLILLSIKVVATGTVVYGKWTTNIYIYFSNGIDNPP